MSLLFSGGSEAARGPEARRGPCSWSALGLPRGPRSGRAICLAAFDIPCVTLTLWEGGRRVTGPFRGWPWALGGSWPSGVPERMDLEELDRRGSPPYSPEQATM